MILFGFPLWLIALMVWCEVCEHDDEPEGREEDETLCA
jgi:hypothetical protein